MRAAQSVLAMHWLYTAYPLILLLSAVLLAVMAGVSWRRPALGARSFALLLVAISIWVATNGLGYFVPDLPSKILLAKFQYLGIVSIAPLWLCFCADYTRQGRPLTPRLRLLLWPVPLAAFLLACTNERHGLIWDKITLRAEPGLPNLAEFGHGPAFWLAVGYFYLLILCGTAALLWAIVRFPRIYRSRMVVLLAAAVLPWIGNVIYLSGLAPYPGFDATPFCFALAGFCIASAVLRKGWLELAPIARDTLFEFMGDAILVLDSGGYLVDLNPAAGRLLNIQGAVVGQPGTHLFYKWPELERLAVISLTQKTIDEFKLNSECVVEAHSTPMLDSRGRYSGRLLQLRDVTARHLAENEIRRAHEKLKNQLEENQQLQLRLQELATRDELTGLYNRRYLEETLARELAAATREVRPLSLILLDIDYFKAINDTYGHATGDQMLHLLGELLAARTRAGDVACRYGGEEFVVLLPGATAEAALKRAEEIRTAFEAVSTRADDLEVRTTLSLGIAEHPGDLTSSAELFRRADQALYAAKGAGRNRAEVFEPKPMQDEVLDKAELPGCLNSKPNQCPV